MYGVWLTKPHIVSSVRGPGTTRQRKDNWLTIRLHRHALLWPRHLRRGRPVKLGAPPAARRRRVHARRRCAGVPHLVPRLVEVVRGGAGLGRRGVHEALRVEREGVPRGGEGGGGARAAVEELAGVGEVLLRALGRRGGKVVELEDRESQSA